MVILPWFSSLNLEYGALGHILTMFGTFPCVMRGFRSKGGVWGLEVGGLTQGANKPDTGCGHILGTYL